MVEKIDTPIERAVLVQRDADVIDYQLAAAALVDLGSGSRRLLRSSLLEAVTVRVGVGRTSSGLLLAAWSPAPGSRARRPRKPGVVGRRA